MHSLIYEAIVDAGKSSHVVRALVMRSHTICYLVKQTPKPKITEISQLGAYEFIPHLIGWLPVSPEGIQFQ